MRKLSEQYPTLKDPVSALRQGAVMVGGRLITNPRALVRTELPVTMRTEAPLRGTVKLRHALGALGVRVCGKLAVDVGASAGGFTVALLEAGARRVYAVDAGYGVLRGTLRSDQRVVNLERTNLASLGPELVPEAVDLLTADLSYLALGRALPELTRLRFAPLAELVALVKPMYELGLAQPPSDEGTLSEAVRTAADGATGCGWQVDAAIRSTITGAHGAVEFFLHAHRRTR
jgi:23S rRNA (cytidine1920-2'-O)/16S rRNA (cytidine1409-2'-O)-methyltransferase